MAITHNEKIALEFSKLAKNADEKKELIKSYFYIFKKCGDEVSPEAILELIKLHKPLSKIDQDKVTNEFTSLLKQITEGYEQSNEENEEDEEDDV